MAEANYNQSPGSYHIPSLVAQDWHHLNCYGCGEKNDRGLHCDFPFDPDSGEMNFSYRTEPFMEGAPGFVHGGILASLLDEAQGVLCFHIGHAVMTDQLSIKYHHATPLGHTIQIRCWLTAVRKRRMYTKATIHDESGRLLVSGRASWYVLPERLMRRKFQEKFPPEEEVRVKTILEENRKRARSIRKRRKGNES